MVIFQHVIIREPPPVFVRKIIDIFCIEMDFRFIVINGIITCQINYFKPCVFVTFIADMCYFGV